jgi:hypothetical protein
MAGLGVLLLAAPLYAEDQLVLKTQKDRENYATGVEFVKKLKQQGGAVNLDIVIRGMQDELTGDTLLMTDQNVPTAVAARKTSADAGQNSEPAVPQKQAAPKRGDDPVPSNAAFAKKEGQTQKTGQAGVNGQILPTQAGASGQILPTYAGKSVAEIGQIRSATRSRARELRKQSIAQGQR